MKRSFQQFEKRLRANGLRAEVTSRAASHFVTLRDLYEGARSPLVLTARLVVYSWLLKKGMSTNEIAKLFDRAPSGVWKMLNR